MEPKISRTKRRKVIYSANNKERSLLEDVWMVLQPRLVLFSVFLSLGGTACQSIQRSLLDDDFSSNRLSWNDSEITNTLPSPQQASDEALQWMKEREELKIASVESGIDDMDNTLAFDSENGNWSINLAQVLVPDMLEAVPYASLGSQKVHGTERRKPMFAKSFGVQADSINTTGLWNVTTTPTASPLKSMAAKNLGAYTVQAGDTLGTISKALYGTPQRWMELAHVNQLGNGSLIYPKEIIFYIKDSQTLGSR